MISAILAGLVAAGAVAAYAWWRRRRSDNGTSSSGDVSRSSTPRNSSRRESDDAFMQDLERQLTRERQEDQRRAERSVRDILQGEDREVAQLLLELAGKGSSTPEFAAADDETIRHIANTVDEHSRTILSFANRAVRQFEEIELEASVSREQVPYPADQFDIAPLGASDIGEVLPEELALDDDVFYAMLGDDALHVIHHFELLRKIRRLYILLDVSGSMAGEMRGKKATRIQWAAGVALKLMLRAVHGEAEYLIRYFGNNVHELHVVTTPEQADVMARELVRLKDWGEGTDIQLALETAVGDIRDGKMQDVETSDILLISDGESSLNSQWLSETFGDKIRLHIAVIGIENPVLANVSSSYEVYA